MLLIIEVIGGNTPGAESLPITTEFEGFEGSVDALAVVVVLGPDPDHGVDIASGVDDAVLLDSFHPVTVENKRLLQVA